MSTTLLILPNQLFDPHPGFEADPGHIVLFEDPLFFGDVQYPARFHKQKLWLHRASMARYAEKLRSRGYNVEVYAYAARRGLAEELFDTLAKGGTTEVVVVDPVDFSATRRLRSASSQNGLPVRMLQNPGFLNAPSDNAAWAQGRKRWFMAEFYKSQRRRLDVLMENNEPLGGQWSFDEDNRKKVPKSKLREIPAIPSINRHPMDLEARESIEKEFPGAIGALDRLIYPTSHEDAQEWLQAFLKERFGLFGPYEDAVVQGESWLWHSVLTPALNIGLITPRQVIDEALAHAALHDVPLNSLEGFVRQIIGWREFMRATYEDMGVQMRTRNHWRHTRAMPRSFYEATTGIDPIDDVIGRVLETGYCHHIERLMLLGGFMFLCEIDPDDVYRWFMEMFVDSYDWVMVPNAYAMSQHADGGLITTKPYFSGSNYVRKMSHWPKGPWADVWDGLYWRFIFKHQSALAKNPRWAMMCRTAAKMPEETRVKHLHNAETFLERLH